MIIKRVAGRRAVLAMSILAVGAGVLAGCTPRENTPAPDSTSKREVVTIITPHNLGIRQAFELGFADWCAAKRDTDVHIDWIVEGTPRCLEYIDRVVAGVDDGRKRHMPNVMFGGGIADHTALADRGYSQAVDLGDLLTGLPAEINGLPTRDAQGRWFATGLSSFGLLYDQASCQKRNIDPPQQWRDLADARFQGWLAVADPVASGSHQQAMIFVLQSLGWDDGWSTLMRILGNTRTLLASSADASDRVSDGLMLASFSVNFDGLRRAAESNGQLVYLNPMGETTVTPDIVSVLKNQRNNELGLEFLRYCLSQKGQAAWALKAGTGGNIGDSLYHYPIDPTIYEKYADDLSVSENPFKTEFGLRLDMPKADALAQLVGPVIESACGDNHIALQQAWVAVIAKDMNAEALAALCAPPFAESELEALAQKVAAADEIELLKMKEQWAAMFAERYRSVLAQLNAPEVPAG